MSSLRTLVADGENFTNLSKSIYQDRNGKSNLLTLSGWLQPFSFVPDSDLLEQTKIGPCGLFAVIQAHILAFRCDPSKTSVSAQSLLVDSILAIESRLSDTFSFCVEYEPGTRMTFRETNNRDEAKRFIEENNYLNQDFSVLFCLISFVRLGFKNEIDPLIGQTQYASFVLIFLLLTGKADEKGIQALDGGNSEEIEQKEIGVKIVGNRDNRLNGYQLNEEASIFVIHRINHFYTAQVIGDDDVLIYDNLAPKKGVQVVPKLSPYFS